MPVYVPPVSTTPGFGPSFGPSFTGHSGPALPPPAPPKPPVQPYVPASRKLVLTSSQGDRIMLTDRANGYRVRAGVRGLGMPPVDLQRRTGAGGGSRWQRTRRAERLIDLPVQVEGSSPEEVSSRMARLVRALDDRYGPATLAVLRPDGVERLIDVHYAGGAEWMDGGDVGSPLRQFMPLTFVAPDPYFHDADATTLEIGTLSGRPFIPFGGPLVTAPSRVAGTLELVNPGDADAYPVWTLRGPGGPWEIRSVTDQASFVIDGTLEEAETVVVDTDAKTVLSGDANRYDLLAASPRLWPIPPGRSVARITVEASTPATSVTVTFTPRWLTGS